MEGRTASLPPYKHVPPPTQEAGLAVRLPLPHPIDPLIALIDELKRVDLTGPLAKLNATTISDNNGGRIEL